MLNERKNSLSLRLKLTFFILLPSSRYRRAMRPSPLPLASAHCSCWSSPLPPQRPHHLYQPHFIILFLRSTRTVGHSIPESRSAAHHHHNRTLSHAITHNYKLYHFSSHISTRIIAHCHTLSRMIVGWKPCR